MHDRMERVTNNNGWGRERVLERVIRKGYIEVGLPHTRQEVLDALFGRRFREWTSPHRRKHLSASVLVSDGHHRRHDACMRAAETRTRHTTVQSMGVKRAEATRHRDDENGRRGGA